MTPEVFAHRGYSARAPENTLASFRMALDSGVRSVELDVHLCSTGEVVVIHDGNLQRTTGVDADVARTPWSTIRGLDAGSWKHARFSGERVPLLAEVFEALGRDVHYDVEIKAARSGVGPLEDAVVSEIRRHGMASSCLITSFNPLSLRRVRRLAPEVETGVLYSGGPSMPLLLRRGQGRFLSGSRVLVPHYRVVTEPMARRAARRRLRVLCWTVDDPDEARRLAALGVAGIITNDPAAIVSALAAKE